MKQSGVFNDAKPAAVNTEADGQRLVTHVFYATMRTISNSTKSTEKASNEHSNKDCSKLNGLKTIQKRVIKTNGHQ